FVDGDVDARAGRVLLDQPVVVLVECAVSPRGERVFQRRFALLLAPLVLFGALPSSFLVVGECLETPARIRRRIEGVEKALCFIAIGLRRRATTVQNFLRLFRFDVSNVLGGRPGGAERCLLRLGDESWDAAHAAPSASNASGTSQPPPSTGATTTNRCGLGNGMTVAEGAAGFDCAGL